MRKKQTKASRMVQNTQRHGKKHKINFSPNSITLFFWKKNEIHHGLMSGLDVGSMSLTPGSDVWLMDPTSKPDVGSMSEPVVRSMGTAHDKFRFFFIITTFFWGLVQIFCFSFMYFRSIFFNEFVLYFGPFAFNEFFFCVFWAFLF